jgi:hypothetical protein
MSFAIKFQLSKIRILEGRHVRGQIGLGIGKLLTAGGCGIWALVDLILYATRKVTDSYGRPLK